MSCLSCVQVCPRNAIVVTSVIPKQVLTVKIEREKCNICLECISSEGNFCPNHLFYVGSIRKNGKDVEAIKFKFNEVGKCQGCLKCEFSCPENAIKPVKFEMESC